MKKIKINYVFLLLWFSWVFFTNYFINNNSWDTNLSNFSTQIVSTWSIISSIETNWSATLANEQSLSFNQTWKVKNIYFKAWDSVKSWDIIALLDDTDWQNTIKQAVINLENSKLNLDSLYDEVDESKILQSKNTIESNKKSIEIAKKELQNLENSKQNWIIDLNNNLINLKKELDSLNESLLQAQKDLDLSKKNFENSILNTNENNLNKINQVKNNYYSDLQNLKQTIEKLDIILWVSDLNKTKNDEYEIYLWAKNNEIKNQTIYKLWILIWKINDFELNINSFDQQNSSIQDNINLINSYILIYNELLNLLDDFYDTLLNSVETTQLTNSMLEWFKSNIISYKNTTNQKISTLNSSINTLKTLTDVDLLNQTNNNSILQKVQNIDGIKLNIEKKLQSIETAKSNLETKILEYDLNIESKNNSISNLEKTLQINEKSYQELIKWPENNDIIKAQNSVKQAELNLENAKKSLEKFEIQAPFDGIIRKIDYQVWDNILSDSDKSIYIENPNLMEIIVYLDQVDIINVKKWDLAYVTFDGYPNIKVKSKINNIDTTPISNSGVVTYKVVIVLDDENFDKKVLSWMTANVEIITKQLNDILLIDSDYISSKWNKYFVLKKTKNWNIETEVQIWELKDWKTQIISWLEIWDIILKETKNNTNTTKTSNTSSNLLNIWWNSNSSRWWFNSQRPPF